MSFKFRPESRLDQLQGRSVHNRLSATKIFHTMLCLFPPNRSPTICDFFYPLELRKNLGFLLYCALHICISKIEVLLLPTDCSAMVLCSFIFHYLWIPYKDNKLDFLFSPGHNRATLLPQGLWSPWKAWRYDLNVNSMCGWAWQGLSRHSLWH